MTIDKEKLVELLVEKTGFEKENVENQLGELVKRIQEAASEGKSFEIEGFGTFSVEDDILHFEPAGPVQTEINHKYTGMKPIELIGAFKDTEDRPLEKEEEADTPVWGFDEDASEEDEKVAESESELESEPEPEPEPEPKEEIVEEGEEVEDKVSAFQLDTSEDEQTEKIEDKPEQEKAQGPKKEKEAIDPIGKVVIYTIVILVGLVTGWFVYDSGILNRSGENSEEIVRQNQPAQSGQSTEPSVTSAEPDPEPDPAVTESESETREEPVYGLKGEVNPDANNGYTIVIHSLRNEERAQSLSNTLQQRGFRSLLMTAVVNGQTYWRVGLGQFERVEDAQAAAGQLPGQYRENHFIKRIQ